MNGHYDIIIIGTGAGGGTLAYRLAPSGKKILLLERGNYVPREKDNWDTKAVVTEGKYHIREPWYDDQGKPFHPGTHYFVGGNTKFYGAALVRLRKEDFGEIRGSFSTRRPRARARASAAPPATAIRAW
jgi:choline dehydrogenase-like flavoprotein